MITIETLGGKHIVVKKFWWSSDMLENIQGVFHNIPFFKNKEASMIILSNYISVAIYF